MFPSPKYVYTSYRFGFLESELFKLGCTILQSPVEKTCVIDFGTYNIVFDRTDGISDGFPFDETVGLHYKYLKEFGTKKYFYVKCSYSPTRCIHHENLAKENNGTVITCPHFSIYSIYNHIFNNRNNLRALKRKSGKIRFLGTYESLTYPTLYKGVGFNYPVTCVDAISLLNDTNILKEKFVITPSRLDQVDIAYNILGPRLEIVGKINELQYINAILQSQALLQPDGISVRHSTYECMCLGIPSIIYENSYLNDSDRKYNFIYNKDSKLNDINEFLENYNPNEVIEHFENTMTPKAILSNVFAQVELLK